MKNKLLKFQPILIKNDLLLQKTYNLKKLDKSKTNKALSLPLLSYAKQEKLKQNKKNKYYFPRSA